MEAASMLSSHYFRVFSAIAPAVACSSRYNIPPRVLNPLPSLIQSNSAGLATAYRQLVVRDGSSFSVRAGGVVAGSAATAATTTMTSFEELKTKGDSYFSADTRPVVLYDGVCNMCNGSVNFVLDNDPVGKLRLAALQSEAGRALLVRSGRAPDDISSLVLVDKDRAYIKSDAVLQIAQYMGFLVPAAAFLAFTVPLFLRDSLYDKVADNRYSILGQTDVCRVSDPRFGERFIE